MPVPVLAVAGAVAAIVFIVVALSVLESRRLEARREAFTREAAQRGWRYASRMEAGTRTERFEGSGLAGPWTAEVIERRGRKRPGVRLMRWWNAPADAPPPAGPFLLMLAVEAEQRLPEEEPAAGALARLAARTVQMALSWASRSASGPCSRCRAWCCSGCGPTARRWTASPSCPIVPTPRASG